MRQTKEFTTIFHLIYLIMLTSFGILLFIVTTIADGPLWFRIGLFPLLIGFWILHIFQVGTEGMRLYLYSILTMLILMLYGSYTTSLTDMPIVLILVIILLSASDDVNIILIVSLSFPLMILYHIFITHYITLAMDWVVLSRLALELVALAGAIGFSHFFVGVNRHNNETIEKLENQLDQSKTENRRFLNGVSHELRTPINAINGITEIMLRGSLEPGIYQQIDDIHHSGRRIFAQVNSILDYSEIIAGNLVINEEDYSVRTACEHAVNRILQGGNAKHLSISWEVAEDMPEFLHGDIEKIDRILAALLDNAYKFTGDGSIRLTAGLRREEYGINLNLDVYDTGIGMTEETINHLFDGIYKADADASRRTGGMGIGFAIAHALTHALNGFMAVESELGRGTHIHVTIPQQIATELQKEESIEAEETESLDLSGLRVLVVDDEPINLTVTRGILKTFGITAKIAECGSEAVALCELEDYDLIFMDYMMPEMDGAEAMQRIRAVRNGFYENTPIVALTANAASGAKKELLDMGFDEFLSKPVDIATMEEALMRLMGGQADE